MLQKQQHGAKVALPAPAVKSFLRMKKTDGRARIQGASVPVRTFSPHRIEVVAD